MKSAVGLVCWVLGFLSGAVLIPVYGQDGQGQNQPLIIYPGESFLVVCENIPPAPTTTQTQTPTSTSKPTLPPTLTPRQTNTPATTPTLSGIFQTATEIKRQTEQAKTPKPSLPPTITTVPMVDPTPSLSIPKLTEQAKGTLLPFATPTEDWGPILPTGLPVKIYKVTYETGMNLRADHTVNSEIVGFLAWGQEIGIVETFEIGGYIWGKGQVGGRWVWVALRMSSGFKYLVEK